MHKKILFSFLVILFLITTLINATTLTVKGKSGYNLTVNVLNPLNNESAIPSLITGNIDSSGQTRLEFASGTTKVNIIVIARVNGKIVKKKELYNIDVQTASPIIVDLLETPAPKPAPTPPPQNTTPTPAPAPTSAPTPAPTPAPAPTSAPTPAPAPETKENKTFLASITGKAISLESIKLSPTTKKITIYVLIGIGALIVLAVIIFLITFFIKRKRKSKNSKDSKDFKITKLSSLRDSENHEDIDEAEKRLKVAKDEINRINEILNKRRAIKEAEKRLEEERQALERLKKGFR